MLAVAARFQETSKKQEILTKEDFEAVFKNARQSFDSNNFARDIANATSNGKLFMSGGEGKSYQLSSYGQDFVDALPDRDAIKGLAKPKGARKKKAQKKAKTSKKK